MHTTVFLAPESLIEPYALVGLIILKCWVATYMTLDVEKCYGGNEKDEPNCRWPKIAEWPSYEAAQKEHS